MHFGMFQAGGELSRRTVQANCPGELVAKCLCKLASSIKSIWHLVSPSYDSMVSIYKLNYWCTWLAMLVMSS